MLRIVTFVSLLVATPAFADDDIPFDPTIDECAAPDSGCLPDQAEPTDASLDADP